MNEGRDDRLNAMARELAQEFAGEEHIATGNPYEYAMMELWRCLCATQGLVPDYLEARVVEDRPQRATKRRKGITSRKRLNVYARDRYRCVTCGSQDDLTLDHIHPVSKGGSNEPSNLQTMCRVCNSRKGATLDGGHLD